MLTELRGPATADATSTGSAANPGPAPRNAAAHERPSGAWSLGETPLRGDWHEVSRSSDEHYRWPDGNVDDYVDYVLYRGDGDFAGMALALGYLDNGDVVGFVLRGAGGSKRGLTYFFPAGDFVETHEKLSMIRGGGSTGRAGFGPDDALPAAYGGFLTDVLGRRVPGKWNVRAVVVGADDHKAMLHHTALQAKLRKLA